MIGNIGHIKYSSKADKTCENKCSILYAEDAFYKRLPRSCIKKKEKLFLAGLSVTAFNLRKIGGLDFNREIWGTGVTDGLNSWNENEGV